MYNKTNFDEIRKHLNHENWGRTFMENGKNKTTDELWESFKSKMDTIREQYIRKKEKCRHHIGKPKEVSH